MTTSILERKISIWTSKFVLHENIKELGTFCAYYGYETLFLPQENIKYIRKQKLKVMHSKKPLNKKRCSNKPYKN